MPGRTFTSSNYRYGFNGKENDPETSTQDYGLRIYNPNLGKFLSVDPLANSYPWNSTYAFAKNDVIRCIDLDGGEKYVAIYEYNSDNEVTKISVIGFKDQKTGEYVDQGLWRKNSNVKQYSDVLTIHKWANGTTDVESLGGSKLSKSKKTVFDRYKISTQQDRGAEKKLDVTSYGLTNGPLLEDVDINRSEIDLSQTINAQFVGGTSNFLPNEASKFDPIIKILKDFPEATVELTGNTASNGPLPGRIYGTGPAVYNQPATVNGNPTQLLAH